MKVNVLIIIKLMFHNNKKLSYYIESRMNINNVEFGQFDFFFNSPIHLSLLTYEKVSQCEISSHFLLIHNYHYFYYFHIILIMIIIIIIGFLITFSLQWDYHMLNYFYGKNDNYKKASHYYEYYFSLNWGGNDPTLMYDYYY